MIKHIFLTPFNHYIVGWYDDEGNCHEDLCITKEDLVALLDKIFVIGKFDGMY